MANLYDTLRTWAEIDLDALEHNMKTIRGHLPQETKVLAVMKSDAYGHGAVRIAQLLEHQADYFAVAMMDEAVELRQAGVQTPILLLGPVQPSDYARALRENVALTITSAEEAEEISACAAAAGKKAKIHVAIDTGMSRIGFPCSREAAEEIVRLIRLPGLEVEGVFSHLALADAADKSYVFYQQQRFRGMVECLENLGASFPIRHLHNSAALVDMPPEFDMVRAGIVLYGLSPSSEVELSHLGDIRPVLSLRSHVTYVKTLPAGVAVSYGCSYRTRRETVVATVCVGYADGVPRALSNKGRVLIRGKSAPIIGRVCMDQFMVDATEIPGIRSGDVVTLLGSDGNESITADEVAECAGSISYELICNVNRRVPRIYLQNGEIECVRRALPGE